MSIFRNNNLPVPWFLSTAIQLHQPNDLHVQSSNPLHKCAARKSSVALHYRSCYNDMNKLSNINRWFRLMHIYIKYTHKWNVSLNFGDQLLDFDLVACFRFLSCKCGPIKLISTNGRNIPDAMTHFRSLAATTANIYLVSFISIIYLSLHDLSRAFFNSGAYSTAPEARTKFLWDFGIKFSWTMIPAKNLPSIDYILP